MKSKRSANTDLKNIELSSDLTMELVQKKFNVQLNVRPNMKLGTYLRRRGIPALARLLRSDK